MTSSSLIIKQVPCSECGLLITVPKKSGDIECRCGAIFQYSPENRYCAYLKFKDVKDGDFDMRINGDIIIGTNERKIVTVSDSIMRSISSSIPIRSAWVSHEHSIIKTQEKSEIKKEGDQQLIVLKTACFLEDNKSVNGTTVNGTSVNTSVELKHGDVIVLAPGCKRYVEIHYFEKRER